MSVTYTAELGDHTVARLAALLLAERIGTRKGTRVPSCREQAVFVLRWFGDGKRVKHMCRNNGISLSAGYRYLQKGIRVLAWQALDLRNALLAAKAAGCGHVVVDGTVVETDWVCVPGPTRGVDLWWSGEVHNHAMSRSSPPRTTAGGCGSRACAPAVKHDSTALPASLRAAGPGRTGPPTAAGSSPISARKGEPTRS